MCNFTGNGLHVLVCTNSMNFWRHTPILLKSAIWNSKYTYFVSLFWLKLRYHSWLIFVTFAPKWSGRNVVFWNWNTNKNNSRHVVTSQFIKRIICIKTNIQRPYDAHVKKVYVKVVVRSSKLHIACRICISHSFIIIYMYAGSVHVLSVLTWDT